MLSQPLHVSLKPDDVVGRGERLTNLHRGDILGVDIGILERRCFDTQKQLFSLKGSMNADGDPLYNFVSRV